jgi:hypothetical protein
MVRARIEKTNVSDDIAGVLFRHQNRIKESADVLASTGSLGWLATLEPLSTPDVAARSLLGSRIRISLP